jgi:hypothetical protein
MLSFFVMVAMLLSGIATVSVCGSERYTLPVDSLSHHARRETEFVEHVRSMVASRRFVFRPIIMQSVELGTTRDTYAYNFFFSLDGQHATVHLPFELVSMVIYTEEWDATTADYSSTLVDGSYYRILFTITREAKTWAFEIVVPLDTGEVQMAIVTAEGTMRYIGSLEPM